MANVRLNPVLQSLRGKIGDLVFKRAFGSVIVARKPEKSNREPSTAQKAHQEKFRQAATYGKMVFADPQARAAYDDAAREKQKPAFALMVADFFNIPSVDIVDLSEYTGQIGSTVGIRASDDFDVVSVDVAIRTPAGVLIESGAAVKSPETGGWLYTATTSVSAGTALKFEVTATDRPGHKTTKIENRQ